MIKTLRKLFSKGEREIAIQLSPKEARFLVEEMGAAQGRAISYGHSERYALAVDLQAKLFASASAQTLEQTRVSDF